jgi:hypothetical protein
MHRVLVCAATRTERDACKRGIDTFVHSTSASHEVLCTGVGPSRTARSLADRLARGPLPDLVISSGFAGALGPELAISSWISGVSVDEWTGGHRTPVDGVKIVLGPADFVRCDVLSSNELVTDLGGDALACKDGRPLVVDMESAALARETSDKGVPFAVLRLISDTPAHPLPSFMAQVTAALAAGSATSRITHGARGLGGLVRNPRGALRLATEGPAWLRQLEAGWVGLAAWSAART